MIQNNAFFVVSVHASVPRYMFASRGVQGQWLLRETLPTPMSPIHCWHFGFAVSCAELDLAVGQNQWDPILG